LVTARLLFGARFAPADHALQRGLTIAGWLSIHVGMLGLFSVLVGVWIAPVLWWMWLYVVADAMLAYWRQERRALILVLTSAAQRGTPLEQSARAFAAERADELGLRVGRLAAALESGAPLSDALKAAHIRLPVDAHVAATVGWQIGGMASSLGNNASYYEQSDAHLREATAKLQYVCGVIAAGVIVTSFMMIKIVPVFAMLFAEFELELPPITIGLIHVCDVAARYWFLVIPLQAAVVLVPVVFALGLAGWWPSGLPLAPRLASGVHTASVLRALAVAVERRRPLEEALLLLAAHYPRASLAQRLYYAAFEVAQGRHWCDALWAEGVIGAVDADVLRAAERAGNLTWALHHLAENHLRRTSARFRAASAFFFPAAMLAMATAAYFFVVGLFLPLIRLIEALT
jgi:type II secretory pathway component PulF